MYVKLGYIEIHSQSLLYAHTYYAGLESLQVVAYHLRTTDKKWWAYLRVVALVRMLGLVLDAVGVLR